MCVYIPISIDLYMYIYLLYLSSIFLTSRALAYTVFHKKLYATNHPKNSCLKKVKFIVMSL